MEGPPPPSSPGKIGPNAVTQLVLALRDSGFNGISTSKFTSANFAAWLTHPPTVMVDERDVVRLHNIVRAAMPREMADALMTEAGKRTADYLLAHRIPRFVQFILKHLPTYMAAIILVSAIRHHAWTFAGSGRFKTHSGSPTIFEIIGNPLCGDRPSTTPACLWHAAVFLRLFQVLVSPHTSVIETECEATGCDCCRFIVDWRPNRRAKLCN
jgi:divinyl protochlorophyllide a 8-vinyl-reductase